MNSITLKVYAKINLALDITNTLPNGYHSIDTLMSSISIFDTLTVKKSKENTVRFTTDIEVKQNSALRSAKLCKELFNIDGVDILIDKKIPFSAGFGGSSADASATFYAISKLYDIDIQKMVKPALSVGSDVPYMLFGGNKRVKGQGEVLTPIELPTMHIVVAQGKIGASTKDVYRAYDYFNHRVNIKNVIDYFNNSCEMPAVFNALQHTSISLCDDIQNTLNMLKKYSDCVFMTGSGSAVVAVFKDENSARKCDRELSDKLFHSYATTLPHGIEIIETK